MDQQPVIAYSERLNADDTANLMVAAPATGMMPASCTNGSWWCGMLVDDTTYDEGTSLSLKINRYGSAMIAYSEEYSGPTNYYLNLKFASTQNWSFLPITKR